MSSSARPSSGAATKPSSTADRLDVLFGLLAVSVIVYRFTRIAMPALRKDSSVTSIIKTLVLLV